MPMGDYKLPQDWVDFYRWKKEQQAIIYFEQIKPGEIKVSNSVGAVNMTYHSMPYKFNFTTGE